MKLVLDWDGTCTFVDSLHMVLEQFGDRDVYEVLLERYTGQRRFLLGTAVAGRGRRELDS